MPIAASKINPCLWFDTEAEEAARFYCSIFKNSKVGTISRNGREGKQIHGKEAGSVMAMTAGWSGTFDRLDNYLAQPNKPRSTTCA
jgi:predicted 3-demethylubiquinone-9 3-methyltransferase (glyoxalase superfamily)